MMRLRFVAAAFLAMMAAITPAAAFTAAPSTRVAVVPRVPTVDLRPAPVLLPVQTSTAAQSKLRLAAVGSGGDDPSSPKAVLGSAAAVGVSTGVLVALFRKALVSGRDFFWSGGPSTAESVLTPVVGGLIVVALKRLVGNFSPKTSLAAEQTKFADYSNSVNSVQHVAKGVGAAATLSTGNSLGPEGPAIELGVYVSRLVCVWAKFRQDAAFRLRMMVAGTAAGVAAAFNTPIAAVFFAREVVLDRQSNREDVKSGAGSLMTQSAMLVSVALATAVAQVVAGPQHCLALPTLCGAWDVPQLAIRTLPVFAALGVSAGLATKAFNHCFNLFNKAGFIAKNPLAPAFAGLATGIASLAAPQVLFHNGESFVHGLMQMQTLASGAASGAVIPGALASLPAGAAVASLLALKIGLTSLSKASGLVGGTLAPSLFIGSATGAALFSAFSAWASVFEPLAITLGAVQLNSFAVAGAAAALSGFFNAPMTGTMIALELTRDFGMAAPVALACAISSWIARKDEPGAGSSAAVALASTVTPRPNVPTPSTSSAAPAPAPVEPPAPAPVEAPAPAPVEADSRQDFLEADPYYDMSNIPVNTYKNKAPFTGTITSVKRIVGAKATGETCDIVIEHGGKMPYWEGQSYGVIPPGDDPKTGKPNKVRLYSIASSRYGDDMTGNTATLCVRRATYWCPELGAEDPAKKGVCSNFLCDATPGTEVKMTGPSGKVMLLPEATPEADIIMVATGTGIAPYRSFIRRLFTENTPYGTDFKGVAWLFLGVANSDALLYDEEWQKVKQDNPEQFRLDYALSREMTNKKGGKMYIQDKVEEYADEIFDRLSKGAHIYFCGLKGMMPGIQDMLKEKCTEKGLIYDDYIKDLKKNGQWHVEVY